MRDSDVVRHSVAISRRQWQRCNGHQSVVWFAGLSDSGRSTLACKIEETQRDSGYPSRVLDGDDLRHGPYADYAVFDEARDANIRRTGRHGIHKCPGSVMSIPDASAALRLPQQHTA